MLSTYLQDTSMNLGMFGDVLEVLIIDGMKKARIFTGTVKGLFIFTLGLFLLKHIGLASWSWWIVFSPLWFPLFVVFSLTCVVGLIVIVYSLYVALIKK